MINNIEIVEYSPKWESSHLEFGKKFWPNKKRRYTPEYIYWKFRGQKNNSLSSFILAIKDKKVIGQFGFIPCELMLNKEKYPAQWICNLLVCPNYRGGEVAKLLYEFADRNGRLTLGSNPSVSCQKSLRKYGYKLISGPRQWILPISIGGTLMLKSDIFKYLKGINNPFCYFFKYKYKENMNNFVPVSAIDILKRKQFSRSKLDYPYVVHDKKFLSWRCNKFKNYYSGIYALKSIYNNSYMCLSVSSGVIYIVDYFYEQFLDLITIVLVAFKFGEEKKLNYVKVLSNSIEDDLYFKKILMIKMRNNTNIVIKESNSSKFKVDFGKKIFYTLMDSDSNI